MLPKYSDNIFCSVYTCLSNEVASLSIKYPNANPKSHAVMIIARLSESKAMVDTAVWLEGWRQSYGDRTSEISNYSIQIHLVVDHRDITKWGTPGVRSHSYSDRNHVLEHCVDGLLHTLAIFLSLP